MKISKKRLASKVRKLEVQNYDMRQKIKKMDKLLTYIDELTTELNHALPDPEYDAKCAENAVAVEESLDRHAVRLGLKKPKLKTLDQSVFDGLPSEYKWIARDKNGDRYAYAGKPHPREVVGVWVNNSELDARFMDAGRDTTNWKGSLIERSDLAKELLEVDLELPQVCPTCGHELEGKHG